MCAVAGSDGKAMFQPQPSASASMTTALLPSLPRRPVARSPIVKVTVLKSADGSAAVHSDSACVTAASSSAWVSTAVGSTGVAGSLAAVSGLALGLAESVGVAVAVSVGVGVGLAVSVGVGDGVGLAVGSGAYVVSTVGVGLGVGDGLLVEDFPDEQVTEFPSGERTQTICELVAGEDEGLGAGAGTLLTVGVGADAGCRTGRRATADGEGIGAIGGRIAAGIRVTSRRIGVRVRTIVRRCTVR